MLVCLTTIEVLSENEISDENNTKTTEKTLNLAPLHDFGTGDFLFLCDFANCSIQVNRLLLWLCKQVHSNDGFNWWILKSIKIVQVYY